MTNAVILLERMHFCYVRGYIGQAPFPHQKERIKGGQSNKSFASLR